jgi:hypothetical protein
VCCALTSVYSFSAIAKPLVTGISSGQIDALRRTSRLKKLLALALLTCWSARFAAAIEIDLPLWLDPTATPEPDGTTVLLWRFEDGAPKDASPGRNLGRVTGGVKPAEGRHGGGVRFAGGDQAIELQVLHATHTSVAVDKSVPFICDFWCRVDKAPDGTACLLDLPGENGLRLELSRDLHLRLLTVAGGATKHAGPLPTDTWIHVALLWTSFAMPGAPFSDGVGIELLLNGETAGVATMSGYDPALAEAATPPPAPQGATPELPKPLPGVPYLCLGNSKKRDAGFVGLIDEFRISRGAQGVYPVVTETFAPPAARSGDPVFRESFDADGILRRVKAAEKPVFPRIAPPIVVSDVKATALSAAELSADDEKLLEEFDSEVSRDPKKQKENASLRLASGAAGQALLVQGGAARLDLPTKEPLPQGSLSFCFKTENWGNLAVARGAKYNFRHVHLLTLWGEPPQGGDPVPLCELRVNRAAGRPAIRPEYRRILGQPAAGQRIVPHQWHEVVVSWSDRFPHLSFQSLDGGMLSWGKQAAPELWKTHRPAFVTLGNEFLTAFDELRLDDSPGAGAVPEPQAIGTLGEFPIAAGDTLLPRVTGTWRKGWVTGMREQGAARAFFGFRPEIEELIVAVAPHDPANVARAEIAFQAGADRVVKAVIPEFAGGLGGVVVSVGKLPPGDYRLTGTLQAADGKPAGTFESSFKRVSVSGVEDDRLGLRDTPPEPFTPVAVEGQSVKAVGRVHAVGADGLYEGLEVLGEQILAAPIRLEAEVDGKPVTLAGKGVAFGPCTPIEAGWEGKADGAGITARLRARFEYDGLAKYELTVSPLGKEARIERLSLLIPLKDRYVQVFHAMPPSSALRNHYTHGGVKPGEGVVWDSIEDFHDRKLGPYVAQMWLGDAQRGLVWCADNDKGWVVDASRPGVTLARTGDVVTLGLHMIDRPLTLTGPREITFQLLATPPKPLPRNYRAWARGDLKTYGTVAGRIMSCDSFAPWAVFCRAGTFDYWPLGDDWDIVRLAVARQRVGDVPKYPQGGTLGFYADAAKGAVHPAAMPYYEWSWGATRYPRSWINQYVYNLNRFIAQGYDSIYLDDVFPNGSWNAAPLGKAYVPDAASGLEGKGRRPGSEAGEMRDLLRRLYGVFVAHGKPPIITTHMSTTLGWPYHSFATVAYDGEDGQRTASGGAHGTFIDAWPLEYLLTFDVAERSGLVTVMMNKDYDKDLRKRGPLQWWALDRSFDAIRFLFDLNGPWPASMASYSGVDVEVLPFWRNGHLVEVQPLIKGPVEERDLPQPKWWKTEHMRKDLVRQPLRATLYKKQNGILLVVGNFLRRSVGARVTLDLDALGVPAEARGRVKVAEADHGRPPKGVDLATFHLEENLMKREAPTNDIGAKDLLADEKELDFEVELDDPKQAADEATKAFHAIKAEGGTVELRVGPHNYRAVELTW